MRLNFVPFVLNWWSYSLDVVIYNMVIERWELFFFIKFRSYVELRWNFWKYFTCERKKERKKWQREIWYELVHEEAMYFCIASCAYDAMNTDYTILYVHANKTKIIGEDAYTNTWEKHYSDMCVMPANSFFFRKNLKYRFRVAIYFLHLWFIILCVSFNKYSIRK